ncbi:hypothetical protein [Zobellia barbeyronii]|uniref:Uncharacterized protein n=1 Tax=Zobellia barbeyronii TaxID=2748009 RepID=A0ABS5W8K2_9FLAO|nr:hypothetical protein [Zobellia barbeyronii]MBT2159756.1 hypothetical protein [Zobellia barbeyronii]
MKYLKFLFLLLVSSVSAQNYQYSLDTPKALEPQQIEEESSLVRVIPQDFDWENIPTDYSDSVWEIRFDFDLAGQTIILPENVTMRFNGGILENGTVRGDESIIETNTENQLFEELSLEGSFASEYLKPQWFGAAMDDKTDDREDFVETLDEAENIGAKVLVDRNMFLDLEETGKKSIFLADNTWLEGANEAHIRINNLLSPAFYMALTKNITITNVTFLYDQKYDASFGWSYDSNTLNIKQLRGYLADEQSIDFDGNNPIWRGPILLRSTIVIDGAHDVLIDNVKFVAKGDTPDKFIQWAIKLKEEYKAGQKVVNDIGTTVIPKKIILRNVTMDGVIMGIQGVVNGFSSNGLTSLRYSDVQSLEGNYIGGTGYWMPPPHLIYFNGDNSTVYDSQNIEILNTIDNGDYVGSEKVRTDVSGYCNSLKLVGNVKNVVVKDYKSYRRDGLWDLENISNGKFENIYAESKSDIFKTTYKYPTARFVGTLDNCTFKNILIKDTANKSLIYPWSSAHGDYVFIEDLHIYVNELPIEEDGPFDFFGSNNTILNSSFHIQNHTATKNYLGVVGLDTDTRMNGSNNHFDVEVFGWRKIDTKTLGKSVKLIFQDLSNSNSNSARIVDVSNSFISKKINHVKTDTWNHTEIIEVGFGASQLLNMEIPYGFAVKKVSMKNIEPMVSGLSVAIGTKDQAEVLIDLDSSSTREVTKDVNLEATPFNRSLYLYADKGLQNKGKIEVTIEFIRKS